MAYPDIFLISGEEFKGSRNTGKNQVDIPFTDEPQIELGDCWTSRWDYYCLFNFIFNTIESRR